MKFDKSGDILGSLTSLFLIIPLLIAPLVLAIFICLNLSALPFLRDSYGSLYFSLNLNSKTEATFQCFILFKWELTIFILVFICSYPSVQIVLLLLLQIFIEIYILHVRPFATYSDNLLAFANELLVSSYLLFCIILSDFT